MSTPSSDHVFLIAENAPSFDRQSLSQPRPSNRLIILNRGGGSDGCCCCCCKILCGLIGVIFLVGVLYGIFVITSPCFRTCVKLGEHVGACVRDCWKGQLASCPKDGFIVCTYLGIDSIAKVAENFN